LSTAGRTLLEQSREQRQTGNTQLAAATLERAIRIEPEQPQYWLELGQIRLQQGNYPQAEQLGRKALSLSASGSQKAAESTQLIADALRAMGRFEEAQQLSIRY
ncbi:MAG: tetratricopeptide repeat protein, partial [Gammaproteobacteria bacterium]|nr:tetratricopeptide repeat protein [Gammaproteobacteria bacterium]